MYSNLHNRVQALERRDADKQRKIDYLLSLLRKRVAGQITNITNEVNADVDELKKWEQAMKDAGFNYGDIDIYINHIKIEVNRRLLQDRYEELVQGYAEMRSKDFISMNFQCTVDNVELIRLAVQENIFSNLTCSFSLLLKPEVKYVYGDATLYITETRIASGKTIIGMSITNNADQEIPTILSIDLTNSGLYKLTPNLVQVCLIYSFSDDKLFLGTSQLGLKDIKFTIELVELTKLKLNDLLKTSTGFCQEFETKSGNKIIPARMNLSWILKELSREEEVEYKLESVGTSYGLSALASLQQLTSSITINYGFELLDYSLGDYQPSFALLAEGQTELITRFGQKLVGLLYPKYQRAGWDITEGVGVFTADVLSDLSDNLTLNSAPSSEGVIYYATDKYAWHNAIMCTLNRSDGKSQIVSGLITYRLRLPQEKYKEFKHTFGLMSKLKRKVEDGTLIENGKFTLSYTDSTGKKFIDFGCIVMSSTICINDITKQANLANFEKDDIVMRNPGPLIWLKKQDEEVFRQCYKENIGEDIGLTYTGDDWDLEIDTKLIIPLTSSLLVSNATIDGNLSINGKEVILNELKQGVWTSGGVDYLSLETDWINAGSVNLAPKWSESIFLDKDPDAPLGSLKNYRFMRGGQTQADYAFDTHFRRFMYLRQDVTDDVSLYTNVGYEADIETEVLPRYVAMNTFQSDDSAIVRTELPNSYPMLLSAKHETVIDYDPDWYDGAMAGELGETWWFSRGYYILPNNSYYVDSQDLTLGNKLEDDYALLPYAMHIENPVRNAQVIWNLADNHIMQVTYSTNVEKHYNWKSAGIIRGSSLATNYYTGTVQGVELFRITPRFKNAVLISSLDKNDEGTVDLQCNIPTSATRKRNINTGIKLSNIEVKINKLALTYNSLEAPTGTNFVSTVSGREQSLHAMKLIYQATTLLDLKVASLNAVIIDIYSKFKQMAEAINTLCTAVEQIQQALSQLFSGNNSVFSIFGQYLSELSQIIMPFQPELAIIFDSIAAGSDALGDFIDGDIAGGIVQTIFALLSGFDQFQDMTELEGTTTKYKDIEEISNKTDFTELDDFSRPGSSISSSSDLMQFYDNFSNSSYSISDAGSICSATRRLISSPSSDIDNWKYNVHEELSIHDDSPINVNNEKKPNSKLVVVEFDTDIIFKDREGLNVTSRKPKMNVVLDSADGDVYIPEMNSALESKIQRTMAIINEIKKKKKARNLLLPKMLSTVFNVGNVSKDILQKAAKVDFKVSNVKNVYKCLTSNSADYNSSSSTRLLDSYLKYVKSGS